MTTPPTNDATGTKPYKVIGINSKAWVEHPDGRRDDFGDDLNRALLVAAKMNLAHAAREPEIAELRRQVAYLDECVKGAGKARELKDADIARLTAEMGRLKKDRDGWASKWQREYENHCRTTNDRDIARDKLAACERERDEARGAALTMESKLAHAEIEAADYRKLYDDAVVLSGQAVEAADRAVTRCESLTAKLRKAEEAVDAWEVFAGSACAPDDHDESAAEAYWDRLKDARAASTALRTPSGEGAACGHYDPWWCAIDDFGHLVDPKACRTCGASEAKHKPTAPSPPVFKARQCPAKNPITNARCVGHEGHGGMHCSKAGLYDPERDIWEIVPIPTPKEEVCDTSTSSGTPTAASAGTSSSQKKPTGGPEESKTDPPATRDAGDDIVLSGDDGIALALYRFRQGVWDEVRAIASIKATTGRAMCRHVGDCQTKKGK